MQRFIENKYTVLTACAVFALALLWNLGHGSLGLLEPHALMAPESVLSAHGATAPPDPWDGIRIAHGATAPPDPWDGIRIAHGATAPPDPWDGLRG
jgi:hypothetical protein